MHVQAGAASATAKLVIQELADATRFSPARERRIAGVSRRTGVLDSLQRIARRSVPSMRRV